MSVAKRDAVFPAMPAESTPIDFGWIRRALRWLIVPAILVAIALAAGAIIGARFARRYETHTAAGGLVVRTDSLGGDAWVLQRTQSGGWTWKPVGLEFSANQYAAPVVADPLGDPGRVTPRDKGTGR